MSHLRRKSVIVGFWQTGRVRRGSLPSYEFSASPDRHRAAVETPGSVCPRRFYQPTLERASAPRAASQFELGAVVARQPADSADTNPFLQPVGGVVARATRLARVFSAGQSAPRRRPSHAP